MLDIRQATMADAPAVARLALALATELCARSGQESCGLSPDIIASRVADDMAGGRTTTFVAARFGQVVGFASLAQGQALAAQGDYGLIQEFYVLPNLRSRGVGARLLAAIKDAARNRGWRHLDLKAPPQPEFARTVAFYQAHGFTSMGGRLMRCPLAP